MQIKMPLDIFVLRGFEDEKFSGLEFFHLNMPAKQLWLVA